MAIGVLTLSLLLMVAMAFVGALRQTIAALRMSNASGSGPSSVAGWRSWILFDIYIRKMNVAFLVGIALYLVTARHSRWHYGVAILALCWIGSRLLSFPWLRAGSQAVLSVLAQDLETRRRRYQSAGNSSQLHAVEELLGQIRSRRATL
jgi:hypothetical protein